MKLLVAMLFLLGGSSALQATGFSVFLVPEKGAGRTDSLSVRKDLYVEFSGAVVQLRLKEARQSIEYPAVAGSRLAFFRLNGEGEREVLASCSVPQGAAKGVVVLTPHAAGLRIRPFWWESTDLRKGHALFVNSSDFDLVVECGAERFPLRRGRQESIRGRFQGDETLRPTRVVISRLRVAQGGKKLVRVLDQSIGIPREDTGVYIVLPKLKDYVSLLPLEPSGARDLDTIKDLKEQLEAAARESAQQDSGG